METNSFEKCHAQDYEDLIESTEGFYPIVEGRGKTIFRDLELNSFPPIMGYNQTREYLKGKF